MRLARVVGRLISTVKDPALEGQRILLIRHVDAEGKPYGKAIVALDSVGAGSNEVVYYVRGKEATFPFLPKEVPSDATIVAIVDRCDGKDVT